MHSSRTRCRTLASSSSRRRCRPRASPRLVAAALRASPVPASPDTGLRTAPCTTVRTGADSTGFASGSVLRTTARGSGRIARHSSAVAAPLRRVPRRRFPHHECRLSVLFSTPEAARFSHPTHRRCRRAGCAPAPPEPAICRQTPPGGVPFMLDRVDALEMRGQGADIIDVLVERFSGEPARDAPEHRLHGAAVLRGTAHAFAASAVRGDFIALARAVDVPGRASEPGGGIHPGLCRDGPRADDFRTGPPLSGFAGPRSYRHSAAAFTR